MDLRILGCHGGESPKHKTSSFLLDGHLAIDAGAITSMLTLDEQRAVDTVLVSHAHLDHIRDLASLADNRAQLGGPPIRVVGLEATLDVLRRHFFNDLLWPDFTKIKTLSGDPTVVLDGVEAEKPALVAGFEVVPVEVNHTIDTCGFLVRNGSGAIAYSGDTGPTDRLWEVLSQAEDLKGLLLEVSFPNEHHALAKASGHHTPETLAADLAKLRNHPALPVLMYHIKPVFEAAVEKQLSELRGDHLDICRLGDELVL